MVNLFLQPREGGMATFPTFLLCGRLTCPIVLYGACLMPDDECRNCLFRFLRD